MKHGTKMGNLIQYINKIKNNPITRIIIFSQWDKMLHLIGNTLEENGIKNVYVKGNVHQRNKAIQTFKTSSDVKVIMLSLENAASGTNLTEATHIFIIDPISGEESEVQQTEAQAIGRVHRRGQQHPLVVIRMIMKDTIEHDIYKKCYEKTNETPKLVRRQSFETVDLQDLALMMETEYSITTPISSPSTITSPIPSDAE